MQPLASYLENMYEEVNPYTFYEDIFETRDLDEEGAFTKGKFVAIACDITNKTYKKKVIDKKTKEVTYVDAPVVNRYTVCKGFDALETLFKSDTGRCYMAPVSYAGKKRTNENARFLYAIVIEIDSLIIKKDDEKQIVQTGMKNLLYQIQNGELPIPTYIVSSGTGLHLYYVLDRALPLYKNVQKSLRNWRREFTNKLWCDVITELHDKVQHESTCQAFRIVGTKCKNLVDVARAFRTGEKVSISYLNQFVKKEHQIEDVYRSELTLKEAKERYPEWYENRIVKQQPRKSWVCNRAVYDWWLKRIISEASSGHRYHCLFMLAIYAIKCGIDYEELENDALSLVERFDRLSIDPANRFTNKDAMAALSVYFEKDYVTYPINSIAYRSGLRIEKNKRNGRSRKEHVRLMNFVRDELNQNHTWNKIGNGRKPKQEVVQEWRKANPDGKKAQCIKETGLSKPTVYKWWEA